MADNRPLFANLDADVRQKVEAILVLCGQLVATEARRAVQKSPRGGRVYKKYNPKRVHKASAPGEPPANDTGALARSITVVAEPERYAVIIKCAPTIAPYAKVLEYGSTDGAIQERPFLRPALKKMAPTVVKLLKKSLKEAIGHA